MVLAGGPKSGFFASSTVGFTAETGVNSVCGEGLTSVGTSVWIGSEALLSVSSVLLGVGLIVRLGVGAEGTALGRLGSVAEGEGEIPASDLGGLTGLGWVEGTERGWGLSFKIVGFWELEGGSGDRWFWVVELSVGLRN